MISTATSNSTVEIKNTFSSFKIGNTHRERLVERSAYGSYLIALAKGAIKNA